MHNQLEKYLSQIEKQLAALPAEQRQEELCEIRSHLEMMIDENVARGFDSDEAVARALEQFGAAKKVAYDLKWTRINRDQRARALLAGLVVFAMWAFLSDSMNHLVRVFLSNPHILLSPEALYIETAFVFLISGWVAEAIAPKKVLLTVVIPYLVWSSIIVLIALMIVALPIVMGVPALMNSSLKSSYQLLINQIINTGVFLFAFLGVWIHRWQVERRQHQSQIIAQ